MGNNGKYKFKFMWLKNHRTRRRSLYQMAPLLFK